MEYLHTSSVRGLCGWSTWYHGVKGLQVFVGDPTFIAHFVYEAVDEAHYRVGHVRALGILEAAFSVIALRHAACNAAHTEAGDKEISVPKAYCGCMPDFQDVAVINGCSSWLGKSTPSGLLVCLFV